jgi:superfamily II DNA/RNA helicase
MSQYHIYSIFLFKENYTIIIMSDKNFDNLVESQNILKGIYLYGFKEPSSIQIEGIKSINSSSDCILQSQSGTGKTATYLIGILNRLNSGYKCGLILTPTRELAVQVYNVCHELVKFTEFKANLCIGGTEIINYKSTNIIIGTLGRINHMFNIKKINKNYIDIVVLDEADNLLSDGVNVDMQNFLNNLKQNIQIVFISATLSRNVFDLSDKLLNNPIKVLLKKTEIAVDLISQFYVDVEIEDYKLDVLLDLYNMISTTQAIIFCNTIRKASWLEEKLKDNNFPITTIHGKMSQQERNNIVDDFRKGDTRLLLTTDLLSRGIDIPQVNLVINYDLPINKDTYIHRIGRCGRFGKKGVSITMVKMEDHYDVKLLNKMKTYFKINIDEIPDNIADYI